MCAFSSGTTVSRSPWHTTISPETLAKMAPSRLDVQVEAQPVGNPRIVAAQAGLPCLVATVATVVDVLEPVDTLREPPDRFLGKAEPMPISHMAILPR